MSFLPRRALTHIHRLGVKEFWSLVRDPTMVVMIVFMFIMIVFGLFAFGRLERYVRRRGTLGMH